MKRRNSQSSRKSALRPTPLPAFGIAVWSFKVRKQEGGLIGRSLAIRGQDPLLGIGRHGLQLIVAAIQSIGDLIPSALVQQKGAPSYVSVRAGVERALSQRRLGLIAELVEHGPAGCLLRGF